MAYINWVGWVGNPSVEHGTELIIYGGGLASTSSVYFVDAASKRLEATSFTIDNDNRLYCVSPKFTVPGIARVFVTVKETAEPGPLGEIDLKFQRQFVTQFLV